MKPKFFRYKKGKISLPAFFPDATRGVIKMLDFKDVEETKTLGILVNTFHLWQGLNMKVLEKYGGIGNFMSWKGAVISDSGGFQVMSQIKKGIVKGKIKDEGVVLYPGKNRRLVFSPEESIRFQIKLGTDIVVVLDDFTDPKSSYKEAKESVERTLLWAKRSKDEFIKLTKGVKIKPYLLGVVQGGEYLDLRKYCTKELVKIGFDGLGWGGWPFDGKGKISFKSAEVISKNTPEDYFLHGLGIGKPEDIVKCVSLGFNIFDCVIPTRDGRHGRLFTFNASSIDKIDIKKKNFYKIFNADKDVNLLDKSSVSSVCDCLLCRKYSRGYLRHLFKIGDVTAMRLSAIHNLRFYSMLMEKSELLLTK
jgi:queuine tRNA-ribosyltransferase